MNKYIEEKEKEKGERGRKKEKEVRISEAGGDSAFVY